jgi:hypothetical protein
MTERIAFKAGDTFSYAAEIPESYLDTDKTWAARAWVRDVGSWRGVPPQIDTLTCVLTPPALPGDPYALVLSKNGGATGTGLWPRPDRPGETRELLCDIELYDNSSPVVVHSTSSFYIDIEFDPTRPA